MEHPGEYGNPMEDEESDEEDNSTTRNGRGSDERMLIPLLFSPVIGVELHTNEYASRHEENRLTATTKDHNMKKKLEVGTVYSPEPHNACCLCIFRL
jgi:hypothetical protein